MKGFYVGKITKSGEVIAFGVFDRVGGLESLHSEYAVSSGPGGYSREVAEYLARQDARDRNAGVE